MWAIFNSVKWLLTSLIDRRYVDNKNIILFVYGFVNKLIVKLHKDDLFNRKTGSYQKILLFR